MSVATEKTRGKSSGFGETVKIVIQALLLALIVRTFLFQPFNIPSGSMKETLLIGDYLFVSKYAYGYSRYSFPFGPNLFEGRIWAAEPERGDVVVFKLPRDNSTDYIKRVIGLPGDQIQVTDGVLSINGKEVEHEKIGDWVDDDGVRYDEIEETLPNGVSYTTLDRGAGSLDNTQVYEVPAGHYFMMGDNRDNSTDSRVLGAVGYVPFENLVGRAEVIFFSVEDGARAWEFWRWPWTVRWDRMFTSVE
ncbi:signal peptidase I [Bauldia litoralis]|uniref:Signal peptidase I n=1 Tax=Bauldia litoralis TaxID=665467 RepID=A0A1G6DA00_9HYPH|nr:signal peptidase I [Bauldia litoralis]SDB41930.1 signal peptidase I [Bauldia litoralis]